MVLNLCRTLLALISRSPLELLNYLACLLLTRFVVRWKLANQTLGLASESITRARAPSSHLGQMFLPPLSVLEEYFILALRPKTSALISSYVRNRLQIWCSLLISVSRSMLIAPVLS